MFGQHVVSGGDMHTDVLVVDDDDDVRGSTAEVIRTGGYSVLEAADGMAALELLQGDGHFGLLLLDMQMPRLNGLQVLAMHDGHPPVIVFSARYHDATTVPEGSDVFMFLRKPVPPQELLAVVAQALARPTT